MSEPESRPVAPPVPEGASGPESERDVASTPVSAPEPVVVTGFEPVTASEPRPPVAPERASAPVSEPESGPAAASEREPGAAPESGSEPAAAPVPESEPASRREAVPLSVPVAESGSEPAAASEREAAPLSGPEAESVAEPEPDAASAPVSGPEAEVVPDSEPEPTASEVAASGSSVPCRGPGSPLSTSSAGAAFRPSCASAPAEAPSPPSRRALAAARSSAVATQAATTSRSRPSFVAAGFSRSAPAEASDVPDASSSASVSAASASGAVPRADSTRVAVSTPPRDPAPPAERFASSRAAPSRGSRCSLASVLASGTGPALPDVGSSDDSRCFDLSGDSPATDASSMRRTSCARYRTRTETIYQCPVYGWNPRGRRERHTYWFHYEAVTHPRQTNVRGVTLSVIHAGRHGWAGAAEHFRRSFCCWRWTRPRVPPRSRSRSTSVWPEHSWWSWRWPDG
ncbi:hypothetical protein STENM223S_11147 [Streptomyces tendae]